MMPNIKISLLVITINILFCSFVCPIFSAFLIIFLIKP